MKAEVIYVTPREEWIKRFDAALLSAGYEVVETKTRPEVLTRGAREAG